MDYDQRYLTGVLLFNRQDYVEAHEVWEDLWAEAHGDERRFYQGLIQAAVGLCHFERSNLGGAVKLYRSASDYMAPCFRTLLAGAPDRGTRPVPGTEPRIALSPAPEAWPDPDDYLGEE